ncbi:LptF/LptG family permease [Algisphaera agarilytica]|uniref:Lipopolysaccharide export LptBFGC system permease protein LptF n=1 Tax=Algisphaera agarilytica TaxID=1385975 RepID=A0A7X0LL28_9BACT|nr:LptF/LptG family permease [Algisphaera agarilytica]MBB6431070.1 lipopolysaccharide export LptBFGC system permease protein LptF [Algisphaera agarilytica]
MPWTLYKYILRELIKLLALTTVVLVIVMSFAAAVQPMSDGKLSASLLVKFVMFIAPTVLGFALPFAGAFATTLVFIRMASDNEILACSASGISYMRVLAPVVALGLVLTGGMMYLSNYVVPSFHRMAERTLQSNVISALVTQLNQQQAFQFPGEDIVVYADSAVEFAPLPTPDSVLPMTQLVQLKGIVVGETDGDGRILQDTTASNAVLHIYGSSETEDSWGVFELEDAVRNSPATGVMMSSGFFKIGPVKLESPFGDDPAFLSAKDLRKYEREPERSSQIRTRIQGLASAMATESLRKAFVVVKDRAVLHGALDGDRYVLSVPSVEEDGEMLRLSSQIDRPIRVEYFSNGLIEGTPSRSYEADSALVRVRTNALTLEPSIDIVLNDVQVSAVGGGPAIGNPTVRFRQLTWPEFLPADLKERRAAELLAEAGGEEYGASKSVGYAVNLLEKSLIILRRNIVGQRHERAASAVSCSLLLLLGSVLSIRLNGQSPLVVYFWSFLLAIVTLIIINSGLNLAAGSKGSLVVGMSVVWSGNALLLVVLVLSYLKMSRN